MKYVQKNREYKPFLLLFQISLPVLSYYGMETNSLLFNCDVTHIDLCRFLQAIRLSDNKREIVE